MVAKWLLQTFAWIAAFAVLLFVPAGTLHWPGAWVFLGFMIATGLGFGVWLAKRDPAHACSVRVHGRRSSFQRSQCVDAVRAASSVSVTMPSCSTWVVVTVNPLYFYHRAVRLGTAVAVELPGVADLFDQPAIHVADDDLVLVARADCDELSARIDQI